MHGPPLVVVAERDVSVNLLLTTILTRGGYRVSSASSVLDVADLTLDLQPALVVASVESDTLRAWIPLARQMHENPDTAQVGLLICSASICVMQHYQASAPHPRERFLSKPFATAQLRHYVRELLPAEE